MQKAVLLVATLVILSIYVGYAEAARWYPTYPRIHVPRKVWRLSKQGRDVSSDISRSSGSDSEADMDTIRVATALKTLAERSLQENDDQ